MENSDNCLTFEVGQMVDHVSGGMPAVVIARQLTTLGRQHYELRDASGRRRHFLGNVLVALDS
ncbi:hypothetical protein BLJAPNOD_03256 [Ensifer sp. M14]|uniref:hypothetical protein n=1 Tax=Ensifer sp. M14 TaxID=2203782 RepID=UPI000E1DA2A2|nr:hypothetical protein [Ensifer sp. M14]RDL52105.1 hypothetical protein BLJAPNOD_03256 [Ensifer sp. M14]